MLSKISVTQLKTSPAAPVSGFSWRGNRPRLGYCAGNSSERNKLRFRILGQSLGDRWKLNDVDAIRMLKRMIELEDKDHMSLQAMAKNIFSAVAPCCSSKERPHEPSGLVKYYIANDAVQEKLNSWLVKTQSFLNEVASTSPLARTGQTKKPVTRDASETQDMEDIFTAEQTINSRTPNGILSLAAVVSIEQFSRMNGLTGQKMQKIFKALVPESTYNDARNLLEYCCFRFLSRDNSDIHPSLKEPPFQRLIFITMLAWENPYREDLANGSDKASFQRKLVREEAFVRMAPAISGVADRSTAHNLFKALAGDEQGISLSTWLTYVDELLKIHEGRKSYQTRQSPNLSEERILCIGSSRKRPVLKWENNMAWPGKVTLTDKAIYFEAVGLAGQKDSIRLDLTKQGLQIKKAKVGPFGSVLFDSAVSISYGPESETWVLEFVDLGGEMKRDVWHAFISEINAVHKFIRNYGPEEDDESIFHVYGAHKGKERAMATAINSIARLQALQFMRKLLDDPTKLVQFTYLQYAPFGDVVSQTLAVNYWGGPLISKNLETDNQPAQGARASNEMIESSSNHVFDIDGSVYLHKWKRSPCWASSASVSFWKNSSTRQGLVLSKNLVVADMALVERAARTCKQKWQEAETTQATIDAATLKGIPSNIDLFKELLLPLTITATNFEKLRRWEEPHLTISFLAFAYTVIFRNLLSYVFPTALMILAAVMLTLKGLKEQGRLRRSFGKITIRDQPPSNTIEKIIAVKDAMHDVESYLQNLNVTLLKIHTIFLSGQPQITTEVALVLLSSATILLIFPFKYVLAFFIFDVFTRELEFRREMVKRFMKLLKERWDRVPAAPVVVLPFGSEEPTPKPNTKESKDPEKSERSLGSSSSV